MKRTNRSAIVVREADGGRIRCARVKSVMYFGADVAQMEKCGSSIESRYFDEVSPKIFMR
jgi:hypothetical protein